MWLLLQRTTNFIETMVVSCFSIGVVLHGPKKKDVIHNLLTLDETHRDPPISDIPLVSYNVHCTTFDPFEGRHMPWTVLMLGWDPHIEVGGRVTNIAYGRACGRRTCILNPQECRQRNDLPIIGLIFLRGR